MSLDKMKSWLLKIGLAGFLFFFVKGLVWVAVLWFGVSLFQLQFDNGIDVDTTSLGTKRSAARYTFKAVRLMNKPKHLIHKIRDNDDGHYEKIGSALLDLQDSHIETGGIEERVTEFHQSLMYDFRTTVMKYIEGSNLPRDWQLLTEDQKFGCSDITVKDFLIEHAFSLQTGKDRANTGRQYLQRSNVIFKDSNVGDFRRYLTLRHLRRKKGQRLPMAHS